MADVIDEAVIEREENVCKVVKFVLEDHWGGEGTGETPLLPPPPPLLTEQLFKFGQLETLKHSLGINA